MGRIRVRVRPGSKRVSLAWDAWRNCWVVSCHARAVSGAANEEILGLLARWLEVPDHHIHWVHAGRSPEKWAEVPELDDAEILERLRRGAFSQRSAASAHKGGTKVGTGPR